MQVDHWRTEANNASTQLAAAQRSHEGLQKVALPQLIEEKERAVRLVDGLQAELSTARAAHSESHSQMEEQLAFLTAELQKVTADNGILRGELTKTVHTRQTTNTKLDMIRKKLGLTENEANVYIQVTRRARQCRQTTKATTLCV